MFAKTFGKEKVADWKKEWIDERMRAAGRIVASLTGSAERLADCT